MKYFILKFFREKNRENPENFGKFRKSWYFWRFMIFFKFNENGTFLPKNGTFLGPYMNFRTL